MYQIRQETAQDCMAIKEVNNLAFGRNNESQLIEELRKSRSFIPQLSLVTETDTREIVGHILFSEISIETKNGSIPSLALAPMAVKPSYQKIGVGSALIKEGLKRCKELGYHSVIVLGHPEYYSKFGFIKASTKGIFPPFDVPDEAFMVYELQPNAFKGIQGTVRYPEPFLNV